MKAKKSDTIIIENKLMRLTKDMDLDAMDYTASCNHADLLDYKAVGSYGIVDFTIKEIMDYLEAEFPRYLTGEQETKEEILDRVISLANELVKNYNYETLVEINELCLDNDIAYYDLDNGFGIEDYTFYYED